VNVIVARDAGDADGDSDAGCDPQPVRNAAQNRRSILCMDPPRDVALALGGQLKTGH
jgi:hypothetical protein